MKVYHINWYIKNIVYDDTIIEWMDMIPSNIMYGEFEIVDWKVVLLPKVDTNDNENRQSDEEIVVEKS